MDKNDNKHTKIFKTKSLKKKTKKNIEAGKTQVVSTKDIVTKGLSINVPLSELSKDINQLATRIVNNGLVKKKLEMDKIEETLKEELGKLINRLIHHKPEIIPILIECSK